MQQLSLFGAPLAGGGAIAAMFENAYSFSKREPSAFVGSSPAAQSPQHPAFRRASPSGTPNTISTAASTTALTGSGPQPIVPPPAPLVAAPGPAAQPSAPPAVASAAVPVAAASGKFPAPLPVQQGPPFFATGAPLTTAEVVASFEHWSAASPAAAGVPSTASADAGSGATAFAKTSAPAAASAASDAAAAVPMSPSRIGIYAGSARSPSHPAICVTDSSQQLAGAPASSSVPELPRTAVASAGPVAAATLAPARPPMPAPAEPAMHPGTEQQAAAYRSMRSSPAEAAATASSSGAGGGGPKSVRFSDSGPDQGIAPEVAAQASAAAGAPESSRHSFTRADTPHFSTETPSLYVDPFLKT